MRASLVTLGFHSCTDRDRVNVPNSDGGKKVGVLVLLTKDWF